MIAITQAHNEARLSGTLAYIEVGTGTAKIAIYSGTRPSTGGTPTGNLLAEIPMSSPAGTVGANALTITAPIEGLVLLTGQAAWARILNRNGDIVADCDVGLVDGGGQVITPGDLMLASLTLYAGGTLRLVSGALG